MNQQFNYKGEALARKRQKLKLTRAEVAQKLTLSTNQITSLEKNLDSGFSTPNFRLLAIKRYASLLDLDLRFVIPEEEPKQKIIADEKLPNKPKKSYFNWIYFLLAMIAFLIFLFNRPEVPNDNANIIVNLENEIIKSNDLAETESYQSNDLPFLSESKLNNASIKPNPDNTNQLATETLENIGSSNIDFICTINTASVKEFSTSNPEKPANYFHLVSLKPQTICTIDSLGNIKTYQLDEGGKITHRGEPPFKIQLDPNKSHLYFQGWIVHLQPQDNFIQLNPKELIEATN